MALCTVAPKWQLLYPATLLRPPEVFSGEEGLLLPSAKESPMSHSGASQDPPDILPSQTRGPLYQVLQPNTEDRMCQRRAPSSVLGNHWAVPSSPSPQNAFISRTEGSYCYPELLPCSGPLVMLIPPTVP